MNIKEFEIYLKKKGKKHIIFDFDGTICDLLIDWSNWKKELQKIFSPCNLSPKGSSGFEYAKAINIYIEKYGDEARDKLLELHYRNEKNYFSGYKLLPVILPILNFAKDHAGLYIWTSNDRRTVMPILEELKMDKFFSKIIFRNDAKYIKPDPEGFALIYDQNNPKEEYLFIGDSETDVETARSAGIDFLDVAEFQIS